MISKKDILFIVGAAHIISGSFTALILTAQTSKLQRHTQLLSLIAIITSLAQTVYIIASRKNK